MNTKELKAEIGGHLKLRGFLKKADHWYFVTPALTTMINVQKSNFGVQHYINIAFAINEENGKPNYLKEHIAPIKTRIEGLFGGEIDTIIQALNLDTDIKIEDRAASIKVLIETLCDRLSKIQSLNDLKALHKDGRLKGFAISKDMQIILKS